MFSVRFDVSKLMLRLLPADTSGIRVIGIETSIIVELMPVRQVPMLTLLELYTSHVELMLTR